MKNLMTLNGQAPGLPFDSALPGAAPAYRDGHCMAMDLLRYIATLQTMPSYSEQERANMAAAALAGFISPFLPLLADALELFADDAQQGMFAGLIEDISNGAAMALDVGRNGGNL